MSFAVLESLDIRTGAVTSHLVTDTHIEAPNWTPDGAALLVNADGRLYRVDLADPGLREIDTGFSQINNDHGLSPDGAWLVISDKTETGKSCIYRVATKGPAAPLRITQNVPSWFHAFSPDGLHIAYPAVRDGQFGIYTAPVTGGEETCVITSPHHYDGPDYTPDGAWIWFNSERGGPASDLWRVRPDGRDARQMTQSDRVEWFPHPSPDGRFVVYLSYPPGTEGHPFGRDVELRLIPATGGDATTLARFYGGQGTLNVPSWAPDSRRFAYVRYNRPA